MNDMIFNLIMTINNLVGIYVTIRLYQGIFKKQKISRNRQFVSMLFVLLIFTILNIINNAIDIGIFIAFILYFLIALLMYQGKIHIKIIASIFVVIFSMVTELLTALAFIPIFGVQIESIRENMLLLFLGGMISKLLLLLIFEIISRIISRKASMVSTSSWLLIITIPAISLYLAVGSVYQEVIANEFSLRSVLLSIAILYINLIAFYLFDRIVQQIHENNQRKFHEEQLLMQQRQYQSILSGYEQVKKVRHDMKNHMVIIESFLENQKYVDASRYLEQLHGDLNAPVKEVISGNVVVDALINHRKKENTNRQIQLCSDIKIPGNFEILDDMDLCIVLGNALDNAYEACDRIIDSNQQKDIQLVMKYDEGTLFIQLSNPYNVDSIRSTSGRFTTSKEEVNMHGIGMNNIEAVVEKYNGILKAEPGKESFELNIMIPDRVPMAV